MAWLVTRIRRRDDSLPRVCATLAGFMLAFFAVYLAGYFDLQTKQDLAYWAKGVATWLMEGPVIYLATLNNISDQRGVGMALLEAMKEFGREKRAALLRVIVTNDNLSALGFYQRRGFRIISVAPGAIDMIRSLMPNIPDMGANRIPIRDEIELEIAL